MDKKDIGLINEEELPNETRRLQKEVPRLSCECANRANCEVELCKAAFKNNPSQSVGTRPGLLKIDESWLLLGNKNSGNIARKGR